MSAMPTAAPARPAPQEPFTVIPMDLSPILRLGVRAVCLTDETGVRVFVDETLSAEEHAESVAAFEKCLAEGEA